MSKTIVLDAGHGLPDPGAVGFGQEYIIAMDIVNEVEKRLPSSIKVIKTRSGKNALNSSKSADLNKRCDIANQTRADLFISVHLNAAASKAATGYETLCYSTNAAARTVHAEIQKVLAANKIADRGIKERKDVRVLRGTNMPALLLECLFISNKSDMDKLNDQAFFAAFCQAIADGIAKAVGAEPKQVTAGASADSSGPYRVFTGTFTSKASAEKAAGMINKLGFKTIIRDESKF